jgi:hypothetical protein
MGSAAACGNSTLTPWVSSGAVTMKITSMTSMTSIYGTTLISDMGRLRVRCLAIGLAKNPVHRRGAEKKSVKRKPFTAPARSSETSACERYVMPVT